MSRFFDMRKKIANEDKVWRALAHETHKTNGDIVSAIEGTD
jgi:hypothetical protein